MSTLVLLKYSNYYNRMVKKESTLSQYRTYQLGNDIEGVNFIPNDFINTEIIVNMQTDGVDPDYLLVIDEDENIKSRWFIISTTRTTAGQFKLELHRDVVVDYYDLIINEPAFIEKATLSDPNDPAIYNNEDMTFNQIKQGEYPLKDKSGIPWIVGYIARDSFKDSDVANRTVTVDTTYEGLADYSVDTSLEEYPYYTFTQREFNSNAQDVLYGINTVFKVHYTRVGNIPETTVYPLGTMEMTASGQYNQFGDFPGTTITGSVTPSGEGDRPYKYAYTFEMPVTTKWDVNSIDGYGVFKNFTPEVMDALNVLLPDYTQGESEAAYRNLLEEEGKIIFNKKDGQYYRVEIDNINKTRETVYISKSKFPTVYNYFYDNINHAYFTGTPDDQTLQVTYSYWTQKLRLTLASAQTTVVIAEPKNRYHLDDSPYDMFCIPYPAADEPLTIKKNGTDYIPAVNRLASFDIALAVAAKGSKGVYDLQLLPYCPFPNVISADGSIDIGNTLNSDINITITGQDPVKASVLLWATTSTFHITIPFNIPTETDPVNKKVKNETEFWRLCSPNYSGVFEFNPQMNNGIEYFDVDCSYKPFNPYIHVTPHFKANTLYGGDYNDARGLVCGGDFSMPQVEHAWANYELQNKNYYQMFARDIQNMEVNNSVQKEREVWQVAAGTVSAGVSGATAGMMTGNPYGALAGIPAAGMSLAGGIRDIQLNDRLRNEALDYKKDMFGYQLQNIKALPQSLAKVSALTANNKIFPFLEKYGCTEIERNALRNKIKYNGMTIMRIGTIAEFEQSTPSYIKCRLIRAIGIPEDFHVLNAIADELYKGVFI